MRKKLLFVNPNLKSRLGFTGVDVKIRGQISALQTKYDVHLVSQNCRETDWIGIKILETMLSQFRFCFYSLKSDVIYYRYTPILIFYNMALLFISMFSTVYIEHNTIPRYELKLSHSWMVVFHVLQMRMLSLSKVKHIAVTREIMEIEKLPKDSFIMPNGYFRDNDEQHDMSSYGNPIENIKHRLIQEKDKGNKILVFVGNDFPWHGLDRIANLVNRLKDSFLLLVGPIKDYREILLLENQGSALRTGHLHPDLLPIIYEMSDFGLGTFGLEKKQMTQACPLKVREYLWYGLPTIINYHDPLLDDEWSKQFIYRVDWDNLDSLRDFLASEYQRDVIRTRARQNLNWKTIFEKIGII